MLLFRTYEFGVIELIARQRQRNLTRILEMEKHILKLDFTSNKTKKKKRLWKESNPQPFP